MSQASTAIVLLDDAELPRDDSWVAARLRAVAAHTPSPHSTHRATVRGWRTAVTAALASGAELIVLLAPGTIPAGAGWLRALRAPLAGGPGAAGAWEVSETDWACVAISREVATVGIEVAGASPVAWARRGAEQAGRPVHRLRSPSPSPAARLGRSYGDAVVQLAGRPGTELRRRAAAVFAAHPSAGADLVRGGAAPDRVYFVLGMHRSGTSCVMACLEQCGVNLGRVERRNYGQVGGNLEQHRALLVNDALLAATGGTWRDPPSERVAAAGAEGAEIAALVAELEAAGPSALKDPRTLFTIDAWLAAARRPGLVGTFRHPEAVARSLWERERMPAATAHELWRRYNRQLVALHRAAPFPLVDFDLSDRSAYCRTMAAAAVQLDLPPRLAAMLSVVEREFSRTRVPPGAPVPPSCAELYGYLRDHRVREPAPGSAAADLIDYFALAEPAAGRGVLQAMEAWGWSRIRYLPRPLRVGAYRALRRLRVRGSD